MQSRLELPVDSTSFEETLVTYREKQTLNQPSGLKRVLLGVGTFGISELVRAIQSYKVTNMNKKIDEASSNVTARLHQTNTTMHNYQLIFDMIDPNRQTPFPNAVKQALTKVHVDFNDIIKEIPEVTLRESFWIMQENVPQKTEKYTEETFTDELISAIKLQLLKTAAEETLTTILRNRGVPMELGYPTALIQSQLDILSEISQLPSNQIPGNLDFLIDTMANQSESLYNYTLAVRQAQPMLQKSLSSSTTSSVKGIKGRLLLHNSGQHVSTVLSELAKKYENEVNNDPNTIPRVITLEEYVELFGKYIRAMGGSTDIKNRAEER